VFFDRFCFDLISLLGEYLNHLTFTDVEYIMRKVYQHSTHFVVPPAGSSEKGSVKLLRYDCVESPFTFEAMTAFDSDTIDRLLERPPTPNEDEPQTINATKGVAGKVRKESINSGSGIDEGEEDHLGDLQQPEGITSGKGPSAGG